MKISQREMFLGVITLAAVLGGSTWWIVNEKIDDWKSKANEIEKLEQQINVSKNAVKMQEAWLGDLLELQKDLRVFDTEQKSVSPDLMTAIKVISSKHELDITRSQPYTEKPTGDLFELGINCTWEGKLEALVGFLAELQLQGAKYDVRTLNVSPAGNNTGRLKGNMVIQCAFTRKPNAGQAN